MATNAKNIIPKYATHPGSILKSELEARDIKSGDFARSIGISETELKSLLKGKTPFSHELALKIENTLGISSLIWLNLQQRYDYVIRVKEQLTRAEETSEKDSPLLRNLHLSPL